MDDIRKILTIVFTVIGILIFYGIIMVKVEVMSRQADAKLKKIESDIAWQGFLYKKSINELLESQKAKPSEEK